MHRMTPLILLALLAAGSPASFASGHLSCSTDLDCSLNGICDQGRCACDVPWSGSACELLMREPTRVAGGGVYGYAPNITSWGGNAIQDVATGKWHLYVSEMAGLGCGLHVWGKQSTVVHATAQTVEGPYHKAATVIRAEAHNPQAIVVNGSWYIFHIGTGVSSTPPTNCNETVGRAAREFSGVGTAGGSTLHRSSGPDGPFEPVSVAPTGCNNPSPVVHPNGTLFLFCTWSIRASLSGSPEGPWGAPRKLSPPTTTARHWEDPFLYFDARGHFHVLSHVWSALPFPSNSISGHAFSIDGHDWTFSPHEPYNNSITHADGSVQLFATLERPKLLFTDRTRPHTPTHLINGASSVWLDGPDPCAVCGPAEGVHCSHCKQQDGIDWTYTLMTPLHCSV